MLKMLSMALMELKMLGEGCWKIESQGFFFWYNQDLGYKWYKPKTL